MNYLRRRILLRGKICRSSAETKTRRPFAEICSQSVRFERMHPCPGCSDLFGKSGQHLSPFLAEGRSAFLAIS
jgi:hypothetical protein